ncbi:hypothetical protein [Pseudarthrobacter sp. MDT1-22]
MKRQRTAAGTLLRSGSLPDAAAAKEELPTLVEATGRPETNKLYWTFCSWWNEIEVLIVTGATTVKPAPKRRYAVPDPFTDPWLAVILLLDAPIELNMLLSH